MIWYYESARRSRITRIIAFAKRARMRAVAHVVRIDFAFSAFSLLPYDVTISIPATTVMAAVARTRILRRVLAIDPPKLCKFHSVVFPSVHDVSVILSVLMPPRKSLALKVKLVLMRLSLLTVASPAAVALIGVPMYVRSVIQRTLRIMRSGRAKLWSDIAKKDIFPTLAYILMVEKISPL